MKKFFNKQQSISVVLAIVASIAAVAGLVYAATTIGTNISVDGTSTLTGNVGIGTTSPAALLAVAGSAYLGNSSANTLTIHSGAINYPISATTTLLNDTINAWSIATSTSITPVFTVDTTSGGRIGIGTQPISGSVAGQMSRLTVNGNITLSPEGSSIEFAAASSTKQGGTASIGFVPSRNSLELVGGGPWSGSVIRLWESVVISDGASAALSGPGGLHVARTAYFATANPGNGPLNTVDSVGIGTTSPQGLFDVNGLLTVKVAGNVGIGTTSPGTLLSVAGDAYFSGTGTTTLSLKTTTASRGTCLEMLDGAGAVYRIFVSTSGILTVAAGPCK